jgi:hypothetical protein
MMSSLRLILHNVMLLFCIDLAKAFDTVDHSILVGRSRSIGVSEGSLAWFANYLRVQYIKSENVLVTKGVPQGSILGPTRFSIYINNIAQAVGNWSYGQILQSLLWSFSAPSGLSLVSLLPLI